MIEPKKPQAYDYAKSYAWNYDHSPPVGSAVEPTSVDCGCDFFGKPVESQLGIAAGPLLNGRWILHYAQLGFDVLTYKTVRSRVRECYAPPNLVPVSASDVAPGEPLEAAATMGQSWAISFGMPSMAPDVWTKDIAWTRAKLPSHKALSVSVVATPEADWTLEQVADDYALCARMAVESGADCIEANFSCPNVQSQDGQLFQNPQLAAIVARRIRQAIGSAPLLIKIGYLNASDDAKRLTAAVVEHIDGFSMTNCIPAPVQSPDGSYFEGASRGIGGAAIRRRSIEQVADFAVATHDTPLRVVGVGGVFTREHFQQYLDAGAQAVHVATAAILDPELASKIK